MSILDLFKESCNCCGTYEYVRQWGYADTSYCTPCAVNHGHKVYSEEELRCKCKDNHEKIKKA